MTAEASETRAAGGTADEMGWNEAEPGFASNLTTSILLVTVTGVYWALSWVAGGLQPLSEIASRATPPACGARYRRKLDFE